MATSLNDTSGAYGQQVLDVTSIIEHAARRCGVSAAVLTAENQSSARENLFMILSDLATRGLSLWCVQRLTLGLPTGLIEYSLPVGTVDVFQALLRRATRTDATSVAAGSATLVSAETIEINSALVTPAAAGLYQLVLEYSDDGVSWTEAGRASVQYVNYPVGVDAARVATALYWRVRDLTDPTRAISEGVFLSALYDVPMSKVARDVYATYPDKYQGSQWPVQYWYNKQFYQPQLVIWAAPTEDLAANLFIQRQIQDPGAYTDAVQVPQRWLNTVISLLAPFVCLELPKELVPPDRYAVLVDRADKALRDAEDSETDGAPIMLAPNISPYTR